VTAPSAPPAVLDLTMPARVVIFSKPEATADDAATPGAQVQVAMVQPTAPPVTDAGSLVTAGSLAAPAPFTARGQLVSTVSVFIPAELVMSGTPFSFALPDELFAAAPDAEVIVTRMNRRNLPAWLQFMQTTRTFKATAIPRGALPIDVLVTIGTQRFKVKITDRPNAE
jgi:hypothetical protein